MKTSAANHMFLTNFVQAVIEAAPRRVHRFLYFCELMPCSVSGVAQWLNPLMQGKFCFYFTVLVLAPPVFRQAACAAIPFHFHPLEVLVGYCLSLKKKSTLMHTPGLSLMKNNLCASTHVCTDTSALKILRKRYLPAGMFRLFK